MLDALLNQCLPPTTEVWAYGSRVTGEAHEASDLDLVVRGANLEPLPLHHLNSLRISLSDSNLPILVDVHDWACLPASFHARILTRYEVVRPGATVAVTA